MATRFLIFLVYFFFLQSAIASKNINNFEDKYQKAKIIILNKITSKKTKHILFIDKIKKIHNFKILLKKCFSENLNSSKDLFAYLQVQDSLSKHKNSVYIFNGWMVKNYPYLNPFEHDSYDLWIDNCY